MNLVGFPHQSSEACRVPSSKLNPKQQNVSFMHQDLTTVGKESGDSQRHSQDLTTVREKRVDRVTETFIKLNSGKREWGESQRPS